MGISNVILTFSQWIYETTSTSFPQRQETVKKCTSIISSKSFIIGFTSFQQQTKRIFSKKNGIEKWPSGKYKISSINAHQDTIYFLQSCPKNCYFPIVTEEFWRQNSNNSISKQIVVKCKQIADKCKQTADKCKQIANKCN